MQVTVRTTEQCLVSASGGQITESLQYVGYVSSEEAEGSVFSTAATTFLTSSPLRALRPDQVSLNTFSPGNPGALLCPGQAFPEGPFALRQR